MTQDPFLPASPLEATLQRVVTGEQERPAFVALLLHSRLFVPTEQPEVTLVEGAPFRPVMLACEEGPMVACFTAAERVKTLLGTVPGLSSGILVDARWVLSHLSEGGGLFVNPGWTESLKISPAEAAKLKQGL